MPKATEAKLISSREEVIRLVKSQTTEVAWLTAKGAIVYIPTLPTVILISEVDASFFDEKYPVPIVIVDGVKGLWISNDLFTSCGKVHNSHDLDWNTHDNLWANLQRGEE